MAGEIREGKRTLIEHDGNVFELPVGHRAELSEGMGEREDETWLGLSTSDEGSLLVVSGMEETDDSVTVHVGREIAGHVIGSGMPMKPVRGYPFPG